MAASITIKSVLGVLGPFLFSYLSLNLSIIHTTLILQGEGEREQKGEKGSRRVDYTQNGLTVG